MSNISSGEVRSFSSGNTASGSGHNNSSLASASTVSNGSTLHPPSKKKRNLPGTPDPNAEVIALSPTTLMATNRFVCEICNKGFQRDQNLQLHRRGHNLPWKLKQRAPGAELRKRVYVCPEASCVHHNPGRALGDLTGIKKHFSRKHGEKKWKCERCSKKYAVHSDWKAHSKTCGTREYKCDCGTIFSRRDSFITHRAFCDALTEENSKANQGFGANTVVQNPSVSEPEHKNTGIQTPLSSLPHHGYDNSLLLASSKPLNVAAATGTIFSNSIGSLLSSLKNNGSVSSAMNGFDGTSMMSSNGGKQPLMSPPTALMSATALLQKAAQMGATATQGLNSPVMQTNCASKMASLSSSSMEREVTQQLDGSYGHAQAQANGRPSTQTTTPINAGLLDNHHRQQDEINSHFLSTNNGNDEDQSSLLSNMGMFNRLLFDQNGSLFMKNMEQGETNGPGGNDQNHGSPGLFGGGRETMTVDFLGIGGTGPPRGLEERHRELLSNHRMLGLNHQFHHQQVSPLEKAMWEV